MIAAAHVHTIATHGPDRVAGFSPIPAMSMVSHAVGARFVAARRRRCSRSTTGTPTCRWLRRRCSATRPTCPESGDWWNACYLIMWGSNVPVTRTPDAHWMAEARYRGQKVVAVVAGLRGQREVRRRLAARAARHRRRAGHGDGPRDPQGVPRRPADAVLRRLPPPLHRPAVPGDAARAGRRPRARAGSSPPPTFPAAAEPPRAPRGRRCCVDGRTGDPGCPTARWASGSAMPARAAGTSTSATSRRSSRCSTTARSPDAGAAAALRHRGRRGRELRRGVPVRRVGEHLVTTVFDLLLAQYGVARPGLPGQWPAGYQDAAEPYTPAWQQSLTSVPAEQCLRIARELARNAEESGGKTMIIMGAGICQWFHGDATYRAILALPILTGSRAATAAAGRTTSGRRSAARSPATRRWRWRSTGPGRRGR